MRIEPPALGRHGEGWVVLQSVVIVAGVSCAIAGPRWPHADEPWLRIAGGALELAAIAIFAVSRLTLGRSFTPLPKPRDRGTLSTTGIYAQVRHPVYAALIVGGVGLALHHSWLVFAPTAVIAVVFWLKSLREEAWLVTRYPGYEDYRRSTRYRFFPGVF
ncbi:MAG TPA: isoprenylcysteine carboxylmethyltransferase family protein [Gaiellaceae bacterium]